MGPADRAIADGDGVEIQVLAGHAADHLRGLERVCRGKIERPVLRGCAQVTMTVIDAIEEVCQTGRLLCSRRRRLSRYQRFGRPRIHAPDRGNYDRNNLPRRQSDAAARASAVRPAPPPHSPPLKGVTIPARRGVSPPPNAGKTGRLPDGFCTADAGAPACATAPVADGISLALWRGARSDVGPPSC